MNLLGERIADPDPAYVFPARFEGFAQTFHEAMARGMVVLASRIDGMKEAIRDGENGLLVNFFEVKGICEKIAETLANSRQNDCLRENARETILRRYDARDMLKRQWEFIQQGGHEL